MADPSDAELLDLHQALLAGNAAASSRLATLLLPLLRVRLGGMRRDVRDWHIVESAIDQSICNYLLDPGRYDPSRSTLLAYLAMDVRGDVKNALASAGRRRRHELVDSEIVELERSDGNVSVEDEVLNSLEPLDVRDELLSAAKDAIAELPPQDRQLLQLIVDGVRSTASYADVLGITHLPLSMQRAEVKRHKDRLTKKLERLRARLV